MDYKARTLDQILAELAPAYKPQVESVKRQQSLVPQTVKADIARADAAKNTAYDDILQGARRRGTGVAFGGIPLGEQAKYASNVYAPAVLDARTRGSERALSLQDAILQIQERQRTRAEDIRQIELDRQFQAQEAAKARAAAARAASASLGYGGASLGGGGAEQSSPDRESAYLEVQQRIGGSSDRDLISDYQATLDSAQRGNARDKLKIQMYQKYRPDLFRVGEGFKSGSYDTPLVRANIGAPTQTRFGRGTIPTYVGTF